MSIVGFLKSHGISPDVWLDQNFLSDETVIEKIVSAAKLSRNDIVLEIGPGTGLLTKKLSKRVKQVVCVEKDYRLFELLVSLFKNSNVEVVHDDIIKYGLKDFKIIISSLPYSIIDWFFKNLLNHSFSKAIVVVSTKTFKKLSDDLLLNSYLKIEKVFDVPKNAFFPVPSIDSVVLLINPKNKSECSISESNIREFYEKNKDKKLIEFLKDRVNIREANKKIADLAWNELKKIFEK